MVRHVQVGATVVVDVPDGARHPEPGIPRSGLLRHVLEATPLDVPEEPVRRAEVSALPRTVVEELRVAAVDEVQVQPAVAVVVEEGAARAGRLDDVAHHVVAEGVPEVDSDLGRHVHEDGRWTLVVG